MEIVFISRLLFCRIFPCYFFLCYISICRASPVLTNSNGNVSKLEINFWPFYISNLTIFSNAANNEPDEPVEISFSFSSVCCNCVKKCGSHGKAWKDCCLFDDADFKDEEDCCTGKNSLWNIFWSHHRQNGFSFIDKSHKNKITQCFTNFSPTWQQKCEAIKFPFSSKKFAGSPLVVRRLHTLVNRLGTNLEPDFQLATE